MINGSVARRGAAIICMGFVLVCVQAARAAEIWLAGVDPFVRQAMHLGSTGDYLELFDDGAPWARAALDVKVFKTSTQYLLNAPDDALRRMIAGLHQRGIALAFEGLMIPRNGSCGEGVEGYSAPGAIQAAAERVRRLGGVIDAVAMDEPVWFGHHYRGARGCMASIEDVAHQVAENIAALRVVFPGVRVGDIEPLDLAAPVAWADEIMHFADAFAAATGRPLDFIEADVDWKQKWRPALSALSARVQAAKIVFGIIYNGDLDDDTDQAWTQHATERFEMVEAMPQGVPDQAILQTWMPRPDRMLPESQPGTMTNLVLSYLRPVTRLDLGEHDGQIVGRLTDVGGQPLAAARVTVTAADGSSLPHLTIRHITGRVPSQAATALVGVRLNTECTCSGSATIRIGPVTYRAQDGRRVDVVVPRPAGTLGPVNQSFDQPASFHVTPASSVSVNSAQFAVAPGIGFNLDLPIGAGKRVEDVGFAAIIFLDATGQEISRRTLGFTPNEVLVAAPFTDAQGRFSVMVPAELRDRADGWQAIFAGDDRWRGATASTLH